jgi:four helix bundle protein
MGETEKRGGGETAIEKIGKAAYSNGGAGMEAIRSYTDLRVYKAAFETAVQVFELTRSFPPEEKFSMTDQMRRASRSVCTNMAEAWRKRRYEASFVSKLSDAETEAEEMRVWFQFAQRFGYTTEAKTQEFDDTYDKILGQLVKMISEPEKWILR